MCGIFGATEKDRFATLYNLNKTRGDFAFGCCFITKNRSIEYIHHQPGILDFDSGLFSSNLDYYYMLGHTQAPTSSQRTYNQDTSHPFVVGDWVVAHNGVLSNYETLREKYLPYHNNPVDSSIIPSLLDFLQSEDEVETIKEVLEALEGTYSVWIFNLKSKNVYIARCGSTLFVDRPSNEFSSTKYDGMEEVSDNTISIVTPEGITEVGGFNGNSPFFII